MSIYQQAFILSALLCSCESGYIIKRACLQAMWTTGASFTPGGPDSDGGTLSFANETYDENASYEDETRLESSSQSPGITVP